MKRVNLTAVLLTANLLLVLAVAYLWRHRNPTGPAPIAGAETEMTPGAGAGLRPIKVVKTNIIEARPFHWSQVEAEDYRAYIARLRSIGCPEQTIRDIIIADIDKLFAPQIHGVNPSAQPLKPWQSDDKEFESAVVFRESQRQQREIDFAKRQLLRELLGIDLVEERRKIRGVEDPAGRRLGFLPDDKRSVVRMIIEQANEAEVNVRLKTWDDGEALSEEDQAQLRKIQQDREAAIAKNLTPAELEQYQLALSPLAHSVRDSLFGMNPSEEEYVTVYGLRKALEEKWPSDAPEPSDPQQRLEYDKAKAELEAQIREKLGDQRYMDYVRARDPDYRQLAIAAARYGLSSTVAAEIYEYKLVVLQERARVVGNRSLTQEQQQAAILGMAAETEDAVRTVLGPRAYSHYLRSGQGAWIHGQATPTP